MSPRLTVLRACAAALACSAALAASVLVAPAALAADEAPTLVVNEVETSSDWIEIANSGTSAVDASGIQVKDSEDDHVLVIPDGTVIEAGGHYAIDTDVTSDGFGLGKADSARIFTADGATLIDEYAWTAHPSTSYGRCPDITGDMVETEEASKGTANICGTDDEEPVVTAGDVVINEVESNGDDTDWVELTNTGDETADVSGYRFLDSDDTHDAYVLPEGSVIQPGGFLVIDQATTTDPEGFDFGLGNPDEVRLFLPDGALDDTTIVAEYAWTDHAATTYGRCPDGTGDFTTTTSSTKGAANDCSVSVVINEIESDPASGDDWVELKNTGAEPADLSGLVIRDDDDAHGYTIPDGTVVDAGAYYLADTLGYGLGGADEVRLFQGETLVDSYAWTSHAATSYGRCPDGTGDVETTGEETPGAANVCDGILTAEAWPGGPTVTTVDEQDTFSGDLSGLDWEPSGSAELGTLWAVQNGDGLLYRLVFDGEHWVAAAEWDLDYADGTGTVDAEGVTLVDDDPANGVYVSSERNNDASTVSRPSVLRYDVSGSDGHLTATQEWNLAEDFPGLGANAGLEGVTWIPDAFLTDGGFVDETTGEAYDPSDYAGHGDGLFFVGVEGTAEVYAYALADDGSFQRIAAIPTPFSLVADVQFDADLDALWVVCDEACDGRTALYELEGGAFAATHVYERPADAENVANEGFAVADDAVCSADGTKPVFYADDNATDGHSLREGTLPCVYTAPGGDGDGSGDGDGDGDGDGSDDASAGSSSSAGSASAGELPRTGGDLPSGVIALAVLLLAAGAGLTFARRRRGTGRRLS